MKVYLFEINDIGWRFYGELAESDVPQIESPKKGIRAWIERHYESLQQSLKESESGAANFARRMWGWLQRLQSADEPMLRALRNASTLKFYYPENLTPESVTRKWVRYLAGRRRHQLIWLILNGLLTPLALLLAPIPGPNVIGWWFFYRAVCHLLAFLGIRSAAKLKATYHPVNRLQQAILPSNTSDISLLSHDLELRHFSEYIDRIHSNKNLQALINDESKATHG